MKPLTNILFVFISLTLFSQTLNSQEETLVQELIFYNYSTNRTVTIQVYPVSMVFNGPDLYGVRRYDLHATNPQENAENPIFHYINGKNTGYTFFDILPLGAPVGFNHDYAGTLSGASGAVGFGVYKVEISWNRNPYGSDTCTIEYDAGYPWPEAGWEADLSIIFRDVDNIPKVYFKWSGDLNEHLIEDFGRKIVAWDQQYDDQRRRRLRSKDNGNFVFDQPVTINNFPQDSRRDCGNELQQFNHNLSGVLSLNLTIDRDVITPSPEILQDFTNRITVLTGSALTVNSGKIFTLNQYSSFANAIIMTIKGVPVYQQQPTGLLSLKNNSQLKVKSKSTLVLEKNSQVTFLPGSKIIIEPGGVFCDKGAVKVGQPTIIRQGPPTTHCLEDAVEITYPDSTNFILLDSAQWHIPDNSTVTFEGSATKLSVNSNCAIKFGSNSKLILKNGASLIASNATFTSLSPGQIWNGIYLEDVAQDTILCCTIENASNGITIRNRYSGAPVSYSAEITGCAFSNNTTSQLNYGLSASNSTNILFRNNNFTSSQLVNGFSRGVIMEYCPQGSLLILDNVITNAETGISILQSSPYIARNSITGQQNVEYGIYLDNSNGTVEYNIVNNFQYRSTGYIPRLIFLKIRSVTQVSGT